MALKRITYATKTNLKPLVDRSKQATAEDFNEIKQVVNTAIDEIASPNNDKVARRAIGVVTVNNNSYTPIFTVQADRLASSVRVSLKGSSGNVVVNTILDILVNHNNDFLITSQSGFYTQLDIKVVSSGNEDYALEVKTITNSTSDSTTLSVEVFPLNNEFITFTSSHNYSSIEHIHTTKKGIYITGSGGNNGDLTSDGNIYCTTLIQTSDKKFKTNIELIDGNWALDVFKKLNFSFYDFSLTNSKQAGLIAQEVQRILPQAVHTSANGEKGLNHTYIDMVCKAAIQYFIKTQIQ